MKPQPITQCELTLFCSSPKPTNQSQIGNALRCPASKFITHALSHLSFLVLLAAATFRLGEKFMPIPTASLSFSDWFDADQSQKPERVESFLKATFRPANILITNVQICLMFWVLGAFVFFIFFKYLFFSVVFLFFFKCFFSLFLFLFLLLNIIPHYTKPRNAAPCHSTLPHTIPHHTKTQHTKPYHTTPHHTTPHHTTPHHTTPHHTTPHHTTPHHTIPHHTTPHHTIPHHTIPHHTTPHHTTPHHTTLHHTTPLPRPLVDGVQADIQPRHPTLPSRQLQLH